MSAFQMLDMCVLYIARRHNMLTDRHVAILDRVWERYENSLPPLPPSPPPERQHVHFDEEGVAHTQEKVIRKRQRLERLEQKPEWPCDRCIDQEVWECGQCVVPVQEQQVDDLWRQVPQGEPVSASMAHEETCGCDICESQDRRRLEEYEAAAQANWTSQERYEQVGGESAPCCSDYLRTCDADRCTYECGEACGSAPPIELAEQHVIDLTCDKESCAYGCDSSHVPLPPIGSCLYGCSFSCGVKEGEDCRAEFDAEGNQLPPVVKAVVDAAADDEYDDMPALIPMQSTQRGWYNPEENVENDTEIVDTVTQQPPKAKPLFPYNHPRWPSPRAKALVQWMIRKGKTSKRAIEYALKQPIKALTHDICMRYLAKYHKLSHEKLLEKTIYLLHNPDPHTPYYNLCTCSFCKAGYSYDW
jgi:hypothetical protein